MALCNICLGAHKAPSVLPCGRVFCYARVLKAVKSVRRFTTGHMSQMPRLPRTVYLLLRDIVPDALQLRMAPSIRKLSITLDNPTPATASRSTKPRSSPSLYMLAKAARDHGLKMQKERDTLAEECRLLKRRLRDDPYVDDAVSMEFAN
ncbi:hypothetical protein FIBSPDRAFT_735830 [Athelia psychrophila]|uniref:Uncharacterized protein n=1 Tax=Athelia psychrophila TaxID=1759441 RepID=A0A166MZY5_9AGAM|nr:hypothetical protein FIBSPDRAFT_735830 [Fibularhizoctonia sp. CBS 109695]